MTQTLNLWPLPLPSPEESREDERTCKRGYRAPLAWRVLRVSRTRACVFCLYFCSLISVSEEISSFFSSNCSAASVGDSNFGFIKRVKVELPLWRIRRTDISSVRPKILINRWLSVQLRANVRDLIIRLELIFQNFGAFLSWRVRRVSFVRVYFARH